MYIYISIHIYILEQWRWLDLKQGAKSLWNSVPKKCADLEQNFNLKEVRHRETWKKCSLALPRVTLQTLGLWARLCSSEKSGKKGPLTLVPYGPISDEKWSRTHMYKKFVLIIYSQTARVNTDFLQLHPPAEGGYLTWSQLLVRVVWQYDTILMLLQRLTIASAA